MSNERKDAESGKCREIAPGVYCLAVAKGISRPNVYFVQSGPSWVLIDAASARCDRVIREAAETLFGANTRPASILLTHDHPDHAGSVLDLVRMWGCPVYMHPNELPMAEGNLSTFEKYASPLDRWAVLPLLHAMPRRRVESMISRASLKGIAQAFDPANVPFLPDWKCVAAPGHTPGEVAFFRPSDRVLITGDAIVTVDLNSFWGLLRWSLRLDKQRVSGPPWYSTWDWRTSKESVANLAGLGPHVLASGHGVPMTGAETATALHVFADHFCRLRPAKG